MASPTSNYRKFIALRIPLSVVEVDKESSENGVRG